jgi:molybdopterin-binding protein
MVTAITDGSVKALKLKRGDRVTVIVRSTEMLIG